MDTLKEVARQAAIASGLTCRVSGEALHKLADAVTLAKILDYLAQPSSGCALTKDETAAVRAGAAALRAPQETGWQSIETLTADYKGQFVAFFPSEPCADMMSGWEEYQTVLGFGQTPASHWWPLVPPAPRPQEAE